MKLVLSRRAERGLARIGVWIGRDNPERAVSYVEELRAECRGLLVYPRRFPLVVPGSDAPKRHGNDLILYRVDDDTVRITAIEHASRDLSDLL